MEQMYKRITDVQLLTSAPLATNPCWWLSFLSSVEWEALLWICIIVFNLFQIFRLCAEDCRLTRIQKTIDDWRIQKEKEFTNLYGDSKPLK